jgi:hypothetical protein
VGVQRALLLNHPGLFMVQCSFLNRNLVSQRVLLGFMPLLRCSHSHACGHLHASRVCRFLTGCHCHDVTTLKDDFFEDATGTVLFPPGNQPHLATRWKRISR